jgi:hypothetical protein
MQRRCGAMSAGQLMVLTQTSVANDLKKLLIFCGDSSSSSANSSTPPLCSTNDYGDALQ